MMRATKGNRDSNEKAIVAVFKEHGWRVDLCSAEGWPDFYATKCTPTRSAQLWVEVKSPGATVRPAQAAMWDAWELNGVTVHILETPEEARAWLNGDGRSRNFRDYRVDERGRGTKRSRPKSWIPARLRARPGT